VSQAGTPVPICSFRANGTTLPAIMREPIRIEIRIEQSSLKRLAIIVGTVVLLAGGVAVAVPVTFATGETLTADQLNTNFRAVEDRVVALESARPVYTNADTGEKYSLDAGYCDSTLPTNGAIGGFAEAKALCETRCGSETAHMCSVQELIRYHQTGGSVTANGWVTHGFAHPGGSWAPPGINECLSWTSYGHLGSVWGSIATSAGGPFYQGCEQVLPIHCCD